MYMHENNDRNIKFIGTEKDKERYPSLKLLDPNKVYKVKKWWPDSKLLTLYEFPAQDHDALERIHEVTFFPIRDGLWEFVM